MPVTANEPPGADLFAKSDPVALTIYRRLLVALKPLGTVKVEVKGTCVHLRGARSAFGGVHPRKAGVLLTIKTIKPIRSSRIRKQEAVSAQRAHNDVLLNDPSQVDDELVDWLMEGMALSGGPAR